MSISRVAVLAIAGCGRLGFDEAEPPEGPPQFAGLIARYAMEGDPALGVIVDDSGNGHDAGCGAAECPTVIEGRFGQGLQFDGVAQLLTIADAPALRLQDGYTATAWVHPDRDAGVRIAFCKPFGDADADSWNLFTLGATTCAETVDSGGEIEPCLDAALPLGRWTHLAERWDGSALTLALNGAVVASATVTGPLLFDDHPAMIGADLDFGARIGLWPGALDEIQLYDHALTDDEVTALSR